MFLEVQARLGKLHARSQADGFNIIEDVDAGLLLLVPVGLPPSLTSLAERIGGGQGYRLPPWTEQRASGPQPALRVSFPQPMLSLRRHGPSDVRANGVDAAEQVPTSLQGACSSKGSGLFQLVASVSPVIST